MKTTVDIPDELLRSIMKRSGAKTIRAAVIAALELHEQRLKQREVVKMFGTFKSIMTQAELRRSREARETRHDTRRQQLVDRSSAGTRRSERSQTRRKSA